MLRQTGSECTEDVRTSGEWNWRSKQLVVRVWRRREGEGKLIRDADFHQIPPEPISSEIVVKHKR
jgi:hypothetical protein